MKVIKTALQAYASQRDSEFRKEVKRKRITNGQKRRFKQWARKQQVLAFNLVG